MLRIEQEFQSMLHRLGIIALQMRVAGPEKREQRQPGDTGIGVGAGALTILIEDAPFLAGAEAVGIPTAIGTLIGGQPAKRRLDCRFAFRRTAALAQDGVVIAR